MDESRKQFERYIKLRGMSAMKRDGAYVESATRFAFDIWKASRAAIEVELPDDRCHGPCCVIVQRKFTTQLIENGIKVKK